MTSKILKSRNSNRNLLSRTMEASARRNSQLKEFKVLSFRKWDRKVRNDRQSTAGFHYKPVLVESFTRLMYVINKKKNKRKTRTTREH